jgi:FxLD family lantipeptide
MATLTIDAVEELDSQGTVALDEFELDLRVVVTSESVPMLCDTGDGCGQTCSTSACNTNSADPV